MTKEDTWFRPFGGRTSGPILVVGLMEPAALRHVKLMALAVLLPIMLVAIALYIYSVLVPGEMTPGH